jgi:hypothetical protein
MASFVCRAVDGTLRFGTLKLHVHCPQVEGKWVGIVITHRYKLEQDRQDYYFPLRSVKREGGTTVLTVAVKLNQLEFKPLYWDIRAVIERDGEQFWIPVRAPIMSTKKKDIMAHYGLRGLFSGRVWY